MSQVIERKKEKENRSEIYVVLMVSALLPGLASGTGDLDRGYLHSDSCLVPCPLALKDFLGSDIFRRLSTR